jgi:hypothetical protein
LKLAAVGVSKTTVDPQQDHCTHRRAGVCEQSLNFFAAKQLGTLPGPVNAYHLSGRPFEFLSITHRALDQAVVPREFKDHAYSLYGVAHSYRPPLICHLGA